MELSNTKFVRRVKSGWEFGEIVPSGKAAEPWRYVVHGVKPSYQEALTQNEMAVSGCPRIGNNSVAEWRGGTPARF